MSVCEDCLSFVMERHCSTSSLPLPYLVVVSLLLLSVFSHFPLAVPLISWSMDELHKLGISGSLPRSEIIEELSYLSTDQLKTLRTALFSSAIVSELAISSAILVNRKDTACNPISAKLANDICMDPGQLLKTQLSHTVDRKCPLRSAHIVVGQSYPLHLFSHHLEQLIWILSSFGLNFCELFKLAEAISSLLFQ